jgi:hypothetical protein
MAVDIARFIHCKARYGYSRLRDKKRHKVPLLNRMEFNLKSNKPAAQGRIFSCCRLPFSLFFVVDPEIMFYIFYIYSSSWGR